VGATGVGSSLAEKAAEALRLAESAPEKAVPLAAEVAARAADAGEPEAGSVAERAWGLALRHAGDLEQAVAHLDEAVRLGRRARSALLVGKARITLAFALFERGRTQPALAAVDAAARGLDGSDRAEALAQRGVILAELGRLDEAMACFRAALPVLRESGNTLWAWRVVWNRGLVHGYRYEFAAADADLREAERLSGELGLAVQVGYAQANIAHMAGLRGDAPTALDYLQRAERRIRAHGAQVGRLLQDRSELLLSVRLISEARESAEQAIDEYVKERREVKLPEARLLLARVGLLDGDAASAMHQARLAEREFTRQQRPEWAALAQLTGLAARRAAGQRLRVGVPALDRLMTTLAAAGWPTATMESRVLAAQILLERRDTGPALDLLHEAGRVRRRRAPATLRARAWYAEALRRSATGARRGAATALRSGLRVLDEHHAVLGATDLRAHAAGHRIDLTDLGLRLAFQDGRPTQVFEWAERGRASHMLRRPVRPPDDPALAVALARLRGILAEVGELGRGQADAPRMARLTRQQVALEREVRDLTRLQPGTPGQGTDHRSEPVPVDALSDLLDGWALVEFVVLDGTVYAVSLVGGRLRMHRLCAEADIDKDLDRITFALHRMIRRDDDPASADAADHLLRRAAGRLDARLFGPLRELGDRPIALVPTGSLQCLPWAVLPSCAGRPLTVSPSATLWYAAASRPVPAAGHVLAAAGPTLPGAVDEALAVAAIYGVSPLLHPAATVTAVHAGLSGAAIAHLATHGHLAAHNPLFSNLQLSDGPLLAYDLERLDRPPHTVVLAACDSARSVTKAGDELLGLGATLLSQGTTQLVASVLPVLDIDTAPVMTDLHRLVAAGEPVAPALAAAQQRSTGTAAAATAAAFICLGAGRGIPPTTTY
jgi:tetratricopeptide (TPR) repeat protein